jgi:DNA-binding transcriptional LysR family regulator
VETRRLQMLLELSRLGSMRNVAERLGTTTSTVSQQIAALARETGTALLEPDGRRVRLTPAGRRLAEHAATILAAVDAARLDLDPDAPPAGTLHVAGFATAIHTALLPIVIELAGSHPAVKVVVHEHEPAEALALLAADRLDLALTYDYNLAPSPPSDITLASVRLWTTGWSLGVPATAANGVTGASPAVFAAFRDSDWIGDSRNRADEHVIRIIASMAGFEPRITHQSDNLDVVEDLIRNGMGVALLPSDRPTPAGITKLALAQPDVRLRVYALARRGRTTWPPLALVLDRLSQRG